MPKKWSNKTCLMWSAQQSFSDCSCTTIHQYPWCIMVHDAKNPCVYIGAFRKITHQKNRQTKKECQKRWVPNCWGAGFVGGLSPTKPHKGKSSSKKPKSFWMRHGHVGNLCRGWSYDVAEITSGETLLQCLQGRVCLIFHVVSTRVVSTRIQETWPCW